MEIPGGLSAYELIRERNMQEIQLAMKATLGEISSMKEEFTNNKPKKETKDGSKKRQKSDIEISYRILRPRRAIDYKEISDPKILKDQKNHSPIHPKPIQKQLGPIFIAGTSIFNQTKYI